MQLFHSNDNIKYFALKKNQQQHKEECKFAGRVTAVLSAFSCVSKTNYNDEGSVELQSPTIGEA